MSCAYHSKSEYGQVHDDDLVDGGEKSIVLDLIPEDVFSFVSGACLSEVTVASADSVEVASYPSVLTGAVIPVVEGPDIDVEALKPVTDGVNVDEFVLCSQPILDMNGLCHCPHYDPGHVPVVVPRPGRSYPQCGDTFF